MAALEPAQERLERHLREAMAHSDPDRVAFWTDAIKCWERPIPDYARSELRAPRKIARSADLCESSA